MCRAGIVSGVVVNLRDDEKRVDQELRTCGAAVREERWHSRASSIVVTQLVCVLRIYIVTHIAGRFFSYPMMRLIQVECVG